MAVLIDPPAWPAHGRLWSHLASDTSLDELHAFAAAAGIPRRGFEGDHYDVPDERYDQLVRAGAHPVPGRELLRRLVAAGLRVPKRRGERVLRSEPLDPSDRLLAARYPDLLAAPVPPGALVEVVRSALGAPAPPVGSRLLVTDPAGRLVLVGGALPPSDPAAAPGGGPVGHLRLRPTGDAPSRHVQVLLVRVRSVRADAVPVPHALARLEAGGDPVAALVTAVLAD